MMTTNPPPSRERFPGGMILLLAYLGALLVSSFVALLHPHPFRIGPVALPPIVRTGLYVVSSLALAAALYGVVRRQAWGRIIAIVFLLALIGAFALEVVLTPLDVPGTIQQAVEEAWRNNGGKLPREIFTPKNEAQTWVILRGLAGGIVSTLPNLAAILYLRRKKTFFLA